MGGGGTCIKNKIGWKNEKKLFLDEMFQLNLLGPYA
jgi:hypothetical protein